LADALLSTRFVSISLLIIHLATSKAKNKMLLHIVFLHGDAGGQHLATCCLVRMVPEWWRSPLYWFEQKENAAQGAA